MSIATKREVEKLLREHCGFSARQAHALVSVGWKAAFKTADASEEIVELLEQSIALLREKA